jgi:hypothetical protein
MACQISFRQSFIRLNNMQFSRVVDFAIEVAEASANTEERPFVERMKRLRTFDFFPGCVIDVESKFPDVPERKFWSRVLFDTARAIFERRVGLHEYAFWQAQAIYQTYGIGLLFEDAVREVEPRWRADTVDVREFHRVVNGIQAPG